MTPEEKAYHFLNENKEQFEKENRSSDDIAVAMFIGGCEFGKCEILKKRDLLFKIDK